jgi:dihydrofolate synthase/folylpolyglutamate synthase
MMDINTALEKLFSLHTFGVKLGLDKIKAFLADLGNPQLNLKTIHIAGSNGKGSTVSFITSILMEAGYKVGLYTSPHFVKFNERIVINGVQIDDEFIAQFITYHWDYIIGQELTFFEVTTALAFEFFNMAAVDYAVIETGLGGRLDATNTINPLAVVITSISLEHTNVLGNSIKEIAGEKAAIIKEGSKVFVSSLPGEAESVIISKCIEEKCELFRLNDFIDQNSKTFKVNSKEINISRFDIPLKGDYQISNALLSLLTVTGCNLVLDNTILLNGIKNVIINTGISGRYECYHKDPVVIMDSAHNIDGIKNFLNEFKKESNLYKSKTVIFGAMKDKAVAEMLIELNECFDEILLTEIHYDRSIKMLDLQNICKNFSIIAHGVSEPVDFIRNFLKGDKENCLVIIGSMYLLGEVKTGLKFNFNLTL